MAAKKKRKTSPKRKIGRKSRPKKKKSVLRKIAKFLALFTGIILILYLAVGFWLGSGALQRDIKGKVAGASTVLSLHIAGPPAKPDITTLAGCQGELPYIQLNWDPTNDTDSYDVFRDDAILVSGLVGTQYRDSDVSLDGSHSYYAVSNGPLGSAQSDTVTETAPSECYVPPPPIPPSPIPPPPPPPPLDVVCRIITLDKIDLTNFRCLPKTKKKTPVFSGTANVSNARIQAEISTPSAKRKVISSFSANENGYWSWGVRGQLKKGTKNIYVKATDPNDSSRFGTCLLRFKIGKNYSKKQMKKCTVAVAYRSLFVPPSYNFSNQLGFEFENKGEYVFSGDIVEFETDFKDAFPATAAKQKVKFQLVDSKNNTVYQIEKDKLPNKNGKITESFKIPLYASSGQYKVIAQMEKDGRIITAEKEIEVKEKPFIELSPNWNLTYNQLLSNLGWAVIILMVILLVFFTLLAFEYHLSQYAVLQVTEKNLKKDGYID